MNVWRKITTVRRMLDVKKCQEATSVFVTLDLRETERFVQVCKTFSICLSWSRLWHVTDTWHMAGGNLSNMILLHITAIDFEQSMHAW